MNRVPIETFTKMYDADADPWGFRTRWYERRKYDLTLAALPRRHYRRAFEPGCSVGVLTAGLAVRCAELIAHDPVPAAVEQARVALVGQPHVHVTQAGLPDDWPEGGFDLIVFSEVGYYLDADTWQATLDRALDCLHPQGDLVLVHWRPAVAGYLLTGDQVHRAALAHPGLERVVEHTEADFLLDVLRRPPARSVAAEDGLR